MFAVTTQSSSYVRRPSPPINVTVRWHGDALVINWYPGPVGGGTVPVRSATPPADCYLIEYRTGIQWDPLAAVVASASSTSTGNKAAPEPINFRWVAASKSANYWFRVKSISGSGSSCRPKPLSGGDSASATASEPSDEVALRARGRLYRVSCICFSSLLKKIISRLFTWQQFETFSKNQPRV